MLVGGRGAEWNRFETASSGAQAATNCRSGSGGQHIHGNEMFVLAYNKTDSNGRRQER